MMGTPAFLMGTTLATISAGIYQLLLGKRVLNVLLVWFLALLGFGLGQLVGDFLAMSPLTWGDLELFTGLLGCWGVLIVAHWLKV